jgi:SEC-C motif-containing protein
MAKIIPNQACPCHSGSAYKVCCAPYHNGKGAPNVEALMRSRYAAYALRKPDYLILTTHPDNPAYHPTPAERAAWRKDILAFCQATLFAGLRILEATETTVTFHAILLGAGDGQDISYIERSRFAQHDGRWKYHSGERVG